MLGVAVVYTSHCLQQIISRT